MVINKAALEKYPRYVPVAERIVLVLRVCDGSLSEKDIADHVECPLEIVAKVCRPLEGRFISYEGKSPRRSAFSHRWTADIFFVEAMKHLNGNAELAVKLGTYDSRRLKKERKELDHYYFKITRLMCQGEQGSAKEFADAVGCTKDHALQFFRSCATPAGLVKSDEVNEIEAKIWVWTGPVAIEHAVEAAKSACIEHKWGHDAR
jgi:hypothetical protein